MIRILAGALSLILFLSAAAPDCDAQLETLIQRLLDAQEKKAQNEEQRRGLDE